MLMSVTGAMLGFTDTTFFTSFSSLFPVGVDREASLPVVCLLIARSSPSESPNLLKRMRVPSLVLRLVCLALSAPLSMTLDPGLSKSWVFSSPDGERRPESDSLIVQNNLDDKSDLKSVVNRMFVATSKDVIEMNETRRERRTFRREKATKTSSKEPDRGREQNMSLSRYRRHKSCWVRLGIR